MHKQMSAAGVALALALGLAGAAAAQGAAAPAAGTRSSTAAAVGSSDVANSLMRMKAHELIGREVVNPAGEDLGALRDIVVNDEDRTMHAVIGVGGFLGIGEKYVAVPFGELRVGSDNVILTTERSARDVKRLPTYSKGQWRSVPPDEALGGR